ncbi:DUF6366 family protein [Priestia flexa]|uniref:DUF6366 family protein n=1 Tax=Priestia flexa TaxID=86664 RepID=UPI0039B6AEB4
MYNGGVYIETRNKTPKNDQERMRQTEIKQNLRDAMHRAETGTAGPDWKSTGILLLSLFIGSVIAAIIFN